MKCLLFILEIGLILPYFTGTAKPNGIELNQEFRELCGHDYVQKVFEICGGSPWRALSPPRFDSSQGSGDNGDFTETSIQNVQRMIDNDGIQHLESNYGKQVLNEEHGMYEQMPGDFNADVSRSRRERNRPMQLALLRTNNRTKLTAGPLSTKCCRSSCTASDIRQLC